MKFNRINGTGLANQIISDICLNLPEGAILSDAIKDRLLKAFESLESVIVDEKAGTVKLTGGAESPLVILLSLPIAQGEARDQIKEMREALSRIGAQGEILDEVIKSGEDMDTFFSITESQTPPSNKELMFLFQRIRNGNSNVNKLLLGIENEGHEKASSELVIKFCQWADINKLTGKALWRRFIELRDKSKARNYSYVDFALEVLSKP